MRYFATRLNGDGTETLIADYLPLSNVSRVTELSGVNSMQATLTPEHLSLLSNNGQPIILPWSTAIYAEDEDAGEIRHAALVKSLTASGPNLTINGVGFLGYLDGMPWTDKLQKLYNVDPADIMHLIWTTVQKHPGGNLGLQVNKLDTKSTVGVRVVTPTNQPRPTTSTKTTSTAIETVVTTTNTVTVLYKDRNVQTVTVTRKATNKKTNAVKTTKTVTTKTTYATKRVVTLVQSYDGGTLKSSKTTTTTLAASSKVQLLAETVTTDEPYILADYATANLAETFNELMTAGSIDVRETHYWDGDAIAHRLELGFPRLGARRNDILFDTTVNCLELPEVTLDAEDYASAVVILGAGEGEKMVRATAENTSPPRLRRVVALDRKGIGRQASANTAAVNALKLYNSFPSDVSSLTINDSALAPFGSWKVGDEVRLIGPAWWGGHLDQYVRILSETVNDGTQAVTLSVIRADKT